jgi:hypothetical protein
MHPTNLNGNDFEPEKIWQKSNLFNFLFMEK